MEPKDRIPLKPEVFHMLLVLVDGPCHGYAIMQEVAERSGGEVRILPGALYRHLERLRADGVIEEIDAPDGDARRRSYRVTEFGRAVARAEAARLARLVTAAERRNLLEKA